jgi:endoglucanase
MSGFSLFGVNLSGAEYDPGGTQEGTNYTYPTDAEIDYYASKGMTVIRLPFLLERVEPVAGGPLRVRPETSRRIAEFSEHEAD